MLSRMLAHASFDSRGLVCRKFASVKTTCRGSAFNTTAAVTEQPRSSFKQSDKLRMRSFASDFAGHARSNAVVGIDLGTTNSCAAVMAGKWPVVIEDERGERTMPSLVHLSAGGGKLVGGEAKRAADPGRTFGSSKRLIGRRLEDLRDVDRCGMVAGDDGEAWMTDGEGKSFSPVELASLLLAELKRTAELYLDEEVSRAVVAVPAHFNHSQRKATKRAALQAGLNVLRIINEPTAAALAYGLGELERLPSMTCDHDELGFGGQKLTAVYDLGGGTFDVSLLQMHDGVFQVRSTDGDPLLGGDDFDDVLTERILAEFGTREATLLRHDKAALTRIKQAAEKAKVELSLMERTVVKLPATSADDSPLEFELSRGEYEKMVGHLVQRTAPPCERALARAGVARRDIEQVLLVGGMTSMPLVRKKAREIFEREPLTDTDYEPGEAVAAGAAIQGAVLTGELSDLLLLDVATAPLKMKGADGGAVETLIERNTVLPARCSRTVDNAALLPHQLLEVSLYQEEEKPVVGVRLPDVRSIEHIGLTRTRLTFEIDADGLVGVWAVDDETGEQRRVQLDHPTRLTMSGSERADLHELLDMTSQYDELSAEQLEHVNLVDTARCLITDTERMIQLHLRRLPVEDASGVMEEMSELRRTLDEMGEAADVGSSEFVRTKLEAAQQKAVALFKKAARPSPPRQK